MPVQDASFMLRDGSTVVSGTEDGDWIRVGKTSYKNLATQVHLPTDGTTITIVIQQADDDSGTNAETVPAGSPPAAITAGAATYQWPLVATRPYLRYRVTAVTGAFGAVQIGVTKANKPITP